MTFVRDAIGRKKARLATFLDRPLNELALRCVGAWPDPGALDEALRQGLTVLPDCRLLYALDTTGRQVSANVSPGRTQPEWRGRHLTGRPFMGASLPYQGFILSPAYVCQRSMEPCITAMHAVRRADKLLGFIAADFNLSELPEAEGPALAPPAWRQFKGDPAIRATLFLQQRANSLMDEHMDDVLAIMETLLLDHGIFHGKLHFSSARFTLWHVDDPYSYQLHGPEEIINTELCLAYGPRPYPSRATVSPARVRPVLHQFKALRQADETVYLRSGSLNVVNGMVGLNFSCDGSHYMSVDEFLSRDLGFWLGGTTASCGGA